MTEEAPKKRGRGERIDPGASARKHGLDGFRKAGILPPDSEPIQEEVQGIINALIEDQGGDAKISTARRVILSMVAKKLFFTAHAYRWLLDNPHEILRRNPETGEVDFSPIIGLRFIAYANSVRLDLLALGLDPPDAPGLDLDEYLKRKARQKGRGDISDRSGSTISSQADREPTGEETTAEEGAE